MRARRLVRMLVVYSKTFYFIDRGAQRGIAYDFGVELEKTLNAAYPDESRPFRVIFIPTSRDRLIPGVAEGRGDIATGGLTITTERLGIVDFTTPASDEVSEILVTSPKAGVPATVEDLSGRQVYVRRSSSYFSSLEALNRRLRTLGRPPVIIQLADENLEDEDVLEMVNAGLVDLTVVDSYLADFWQQVFTGIRPQAQLTLRSNAQVAWAIRRGSPEWKRTLDAFVAKHRLGTATGNVILKRYLRTTKWVRGATADADMKRFNEVARYFQKYAAEYRFEWLLLIAQGYQESGLDQKVRSPVGAIGVMQVMPTTARDKNVNIPDIHVTERNIEAGVKYLRFLVDQYFDEPEIDLVNRHLFAFAAYNGGPNRIARLRRVAAGRGLDANRWFNNVEIVAAEEIGRETVQYVSNIFKYYIAYKLVADQARQREALKHKAITAARSPPPSH